PGRAHPPETLAYRLARDADQLGEVALAQAQVAAQLAVEVEQLGGQPGRRRQRDDARLAMDQRAEIATDQPRIGDREGREMHGDRLDIGIAQAEYARSAVRDQG